MNHHRRLATIALSLTAVITATACRPKPVEPPAPVVQGPNQDSIRAAEEARRRQQAYDDSVNRARALADARQRQINDSIQNAARAAEAAAQASAARRATMTTTVYFDYDKSELRDDTRQALDAKVPILTANPSLMIRIAGHTDNRGSGEYNLQLGQRRAAAARDYLTARGVAANRIELVSYGEERPTCQSMDDACHGQNRRAEFEITAGPQVLR